jgi:hypothetical protein
MSDFLKEGFIVKIPALRSISEYWEVKAREPFVYETGTSTTAEFTAVANGSDSDWKNVTTLEPDETPRRLYQVRMGFKDGMDYYVKIPTGSNRFGVDQDKDVGFLNSTTCHYAAKNEDYEFWLVHDYYPSINASNDSGTQKTPKIYFSGMKYDIEKADSARAQRAEAEKRYRMVVIGGTQVG